MSAPATPTIPVPTLAPAPPPVVVPAPSRVSDVPTVPIYRLSVAQYHAMIRHGILSEDDPVELLEGWLVKKMTRSPPHTFATQTLRDLVPGLLPQGWFGPLRCGRLGSVWISFPAVEPIPGWNNDVPICRFSIDTVCNHIRSVLEITARCVRIDMNSS